MAALEAGTKTRRKKAVAGSQLDLIFSKEPTQPKGQSPIVLSPEHWQPAPTASGATSAPQPAEEWSSPGGGGGRRAASR